MLVLGHVEVFAHEAHDGITDHAKGGAVGIDLCQLFIHAFVDLNDFRNSHPDRTLKTKSKKQKHPAGRFTTWTVEETHGWYTMRNVVFHVPYGFLYGPIVRRALEGVPSSLPAPMVLVSPGAGWIVPKAAGGGRFRPATGSQERSGLPAQGHVAAAPESPRKTGHRNDMARHPPPPGSHMTLPGNTCKWSEFTPLASVRAIHGQAHSEPCLAPAMVSHAFEGKGQKLLLPAQERSSDRQ